MIARPRPADPIVNRPRAPAVEAENVSYVYAREAGERLALDGLSLGVERGAIYGLLGPNGSGKSTFLSLVAGLRRPSSGAVRVFGETPGVRVRRRVGVLFQEQCLDPLMTLRETLWLHGRLFGMGGARLREEIDASLAAVGLAHRAGEPTRTLSGGMRRRLELARALISGPDLLLLDEPTTGLDPDSRRELWRRLTGARHDGLTVMLATNDVGEAERYCDRVAFLSGGRVAAEGTPAELKANLRHDSVILEAPGVSDGAVSALGSWPGVGRVTWAPPAVHVTVDDAGAFIVRLFESRAFPVTSVRIEESTLEDAYFQLCGRAIHEGAQT